MNRHTTDKASDPSTDTGIHEGTPDGPPHLISRIRAAANFVFLVAGLLFLLGFLLVIGGVGTFTTYTLEHIVLVLRYIGLIAALAFVTSIISIVLENRSDSAPRPEEES